MKFTSWRSSITVLSFLVGLGFVQPTYGEYIPGVDDDDGYSDRYTGRRSRRRSRRLNTRKRYYSRKKNRVRRKRSKQKKYTTRQVASNKRYEEFLSAESKLPSSKKGSDALDLRLGVLGGLTLSGNETLPTNQPSFGLQADLRYSFFGAEVDGFYALAGTKSNTFEDGNFRLDEQIKRSYYAAVATAKVFYPLYLGSTKISPKLGGGFALFNASQESITSGPADLLAVDGNPNEIIEVSGTDDARFSAPFVTAGVDVKSGPLYGLADFGVGVGVNPQTGGALDIRGGSLKRLRVGFYYEVNLNLYLGGLFQYWETGLNAAFVDPSTGETFIQSGTEIFSQFYASAIFSF